MPKTGISVTLRDENLLWLKSRALATRSRSLSETLDELVTAARTGGDTPASAIRSVTGTVDITTDDPGLDDADAYIQDLFKASIARPFLVREEPVRAGRRPAKGRRRG